ncbi:GMC oxidoreductase [Apiospora arundinis]
MAESRDEMASESSAVPCVALFSVEALNLEGEEVEQDEGEESRAEDDDEHDNGVEKLGTRRPPRHLPCHA